MNLKEFVGSGAKIRLFTLPFLITVIKIPITILLFVIFFISFITSPQSHTASRRRSSSYEPRLDVRAASDLPSSEA